MSEELTITKERVLEASKSCGEARSVLKVLFPEAFEREVEEVDIFDECTISHEGNGILFMHDGYYVCTLEIDTENSYINVLPKEYKVSLNPFHIRLLKKSAGK